MTSQKLLPYLSTYQIHSATLDTGVLENTLILERLVELKQKFNILIGLTSSGANQTEILQKAMPIKINGEFLFDAFQVTYNIFDQSLFEQCKELVAQGRRVIIKEALANGRVFPNEKFPNYNLAYQTLQDLAKKYHVGIDAIALRFCIDNLSPYKVLSGAAMPEHLNQNLKAKEFRLTTSDLILLKNLKVAPTKYWSERKKLTWN